MINLKPLVWAGALLLTVAALASSSNQNFALAAQDKVPFEAEILRFEATDAKNPPAKGGIVFVGSSSIVLWKSLAQDYPRHKVINRGFGGSQISDSVRFAHRIVTPYEPQMVVFFAGTNDIAAGKSAETVRDDYRAFVRRVRAKLPAARIAFISISPAPSRWAKIEEIKRANALIRQLSLQEENLVYIDVFSHMLDEKGGPRPELFVEDQLHLNDKGYAIWKKVVAPYLPWGNSTKAGGRADSRLFSLNPN
jgi:lysophospholipase L1-like esterase